MPDRDERAAEDQVTRLTEIMSAITDLVIKLEDVQPAVQEIKQELRDHIHEEAGILRRAFPDGDPDKHRSAHEAWIRKAEAEAKAAEDRAEIMLAAKKKAAEMTVYGVLIALLAVFIYFWNGHVPEAMQIPMPKL